MIKVGQLVSANPFAHMKDTQGLPELRRMRVGRVIRVHEDHQWFTAEFGKDGLKVSYKFADIGKSVSIIR